MKEVMEQYGKAVLSAFAAFFLFAALFTGIKAGEAKGLFAVLGANAALPGTDYSLYKDGEKTALVMEKERPQITLAEREIKTGCEYEAVDLFSASDVLGNAAKIKILNVTDSTGQEVEETGGRMKFERQGVYRILVKAIDSDCGITENEFFVPVRRR